MLPHQAAEDGVEVGGYAVPKDSTVIFNTWAIMRDPAAWERPNEFVPGRWLSGDDRRTTGAVDYRGKDFEFIPFGSGRRMCPGLPMAERVVPHVLASLLNAFEWRLPDGVSAEQLDVREKFTTANVMAVHFKAVPSRDQLRSAEAPRVLGVDERPIYFFCL
jgi:cytochrome P450